MTSSIQPASRFTPRHWSFATRLTTAAVVLIAVTIVAVILPVLQTVETHLVEQVGTNFEAQAINLNNLTSLFLLEKASQLRVLAKSELLQEAIITRNASYTGNEAEIMEGILQLDEQWITAADDDPLIAGVTAGDLALNPAGHQLADFFQDFPAHREVFITDRYGATIGATGRLTDYYQADEEWWQAAWNDGQGATYISSPQFDESAQITGVLIGLPILDENTGEVIGILRSTLEMTELYDLLGSFVFGETGHTFLLDSSGETLFENVREGEAEEEEDLAADVRRRLVEEPTGYLRAIDGDGDESIFGHAALDTDSFQNRASNLERETITAIQRLGWVTAVRQESHEALSSLGAIEQASQVVGILTISAAAVLSFFLSRSITTPLAELNRAAQKVGEGQLDVTLSTTTGGEIGELTASFNQMTGRLRDSLASLTRRTEELERSNAELEQFAYVASHDLKAPLRAIASLSSWIEEDIQESLTEDTRQQMHLLRGRVHRMENLIEGILQYSRAGRTLNPPEKVQVNELLTEIRDSLAPPAGFQIQIAPNMPTIVAERVKLEQVFMNLLSNAMKHHDRPDGRIQISSRRLGNGLHEFAITDDGPGIAPQYHEKVFQIFQTLKARDEVESTGVGLAVVKKIVEEQGGTIHIESKEGEGATFRFTWQDNNKGKK